MHIFITGTDTNVGKTLVASWLCLHTGYDYFKPIQTGSIEGTDSNQILKLSKNYNQPNKQNNNKNYKNIIVHKETYLYQEAVSPHLAAKLNNQIIDISKIQIPTNVNDLIIEGAGGVLTPINQQLLMADLIKQLSVSVILVARSSLGTINHTLLSLEVLRVRKINILGVVVSGELNQDNCDAIEWYGKIKVLAQVPMLKNINTESLLDIPLSFELNKIITSF